MTQTEALKLALEALEFVNQTGDTQVFDMHYADKAITAIKEALAQPEQEPVAVIGSGFQLLYCRNDWSKGLKVGDCLYTTPPQPEQEPVAYDKTEMNGFVQNLYDKKMQDGKHGHYETMFHVVHQAIKRVAPPQRTWVGLTGGEVLDVLVSVDKETVRLPSMLGIFARAIEAKLKEKNT